MLEAVFVADVGYGVAQFVNIFLVDELGYDLLGVGGGDSPLAELLTDLFDAVLAAAALGCGTA